MTSISRRDLLLTGGLAVSSAIGGCLLDNSSAGTGNIYVENNTDEERRLALWVASGDGGDPIIQHWYRVPSNHALEFTGVIEEGETYDVRAARPDAPPEDRVATVIGPCDDEPSGERVVSVRTGADGVGVIPWGCSETYSEREMDYVDASDYEQEPLDGTVTEPPTGGETKTQEV